MDEYRRFTLWSEQVALRLAQEQEWSRLAAFLHETGGVARDLVGLVESLPPLRGKWWELGLALLAWARRHPDPLAPTRARLRALQQQYADVGISPTAAHN
jgi:hypothetical protein